MNLSPSKVDCFFGCKRLFSYRYIEKPITPPFNKYFFIGNVVHKALELFHSKLDVVNDDQWGKLMSKAFKAALVKHNTKEALTKGKLERDKVPLMKSMLQKYLTYLKSQEEKPNTVSMEVLFGIPIASTKTYGKADRVDQVDENTIKVIDYKTSSRPTPKKEALKSVQLPTYGLWIKKHNTDFGGEDKQVFGEYVYVRNLEKKSGIHTFEITDAMIADAIEKYTRVNFELSNGCKFEKNKDYKYCGPGKCDYYEYCRKD